MKLKFKEQAYQLHAVESLADCFAGQPKSSGASYRIDPGVGSAAFAPQQGSLAGMELQPALAPLDAGFRNAELALTPAQLLVNVQAVQRRQNLPQSAALVNDKKTGCPINLDIEMETGTGKTYCYIRSMFELNKRYGWSKFIIVVPSIAIREGVHKSLQITAEHFLERYGKKARFFIYNSKQLHNLESFSSDAGINVMVINVQAFNAKGKDNRRIYEELDDFQSRRPIDVIKANRPILILDEPQKRLLLHRQEEQASGGPGDRQEVQRDRRRGRLRPDPQGQGAPAVVRGAGALHLLPLGAARRLGQPQRLRHLHPQAQRQQHLAASGGRARPASGGQPAWRAHGLPGHGA